jgi:integrase
MNTEILKPIVPPHHGLVLAGGFSRRMAKDKAGLRVGEIRELRWSDFLDGAEPVLILRGTTTKNGKTEHQPIREVLADRLRRLLAIRPGAPLASIFQRKFFWKLPKLLRADLAQAKIQSKDDQGRRVDVHALRHTYITALARGGAPLAIVQRLARHSSPVLTARVYVHLGLADKRQALSVQDQGAAHPFLANYGGKWVNGRHRGLIIIRKSNNVKKQSEKCLMTHKFFSNFMQGCQVVD